MQAGSTEYLGIPQAATLRFSGPFDGGYDAGCEKLAGWVEENGYAFARLPRGHAIISPADAAEQEN
ncbi:MAG: hypothetical protein FWG23_02305 [Eggerthellaceae bacterium]|nr:hypothetical protein [Eggerthellaceae bacterium]